MAFLGGDHSIERSADISLATGLLVAAGSAVTGLTDWSAAYGQERRVGPLYGPVMVYTTVTCVAWLLARRSWSRGADVALGSADYALALAGAYFGGEEVSDIR